MMGSRYCVLPRLSCLILAAVFAPHVPAQLVVKLSPETVSEFERYSTTVESDLEDRWHGKKNLFYMEDDKENEQRVLNGEILIKQMNNGRPVDIKDGLIHDWLGAVYIPGTTVKRVIEILEDFD